MISTTSSFTVATRGKGTYPLTEEIARLVRESGVGDGLATISVAHTSASLVIYENADPTARQDLHRYFEELVPENADYIHDMEGPDDSTSHLRMALTRTSESIPVAKGRLCLGTWQGVYLFEHRRAPHTRKLFVNVLGT